MDVLSGFATDLAERGVIAVDPVSGWWQEQPELDRSHVDARYALFVCIKTKSSEAGIRTPVAAELGVPIENAGRTTVERGAAVE